MNVRIKICGLFRNCDVEYINEAMPDYAGFVFAESKRRVTESKAAELRRHIRPGIQVVGVFADAPQEQIVRLVQSGVIDGVQLHGREDANYAARLRERLEEIKTGIPLIKALSVGKRPVAELELADYGRRGVDYFLFDQGGGGTGQTFDWNKMPPTDLPFFLAGGLKKGNVEEAIRVTGPYAVDISSGVETDGMKDRDKILEIIRRVRNVERKIWEPRRSICAGNTDERTDPAGTGL